MVDVKVGFDKRRQKQLHEEPASGKAVIGKPRVKCCYSIVGLNVSGMDCVALSFK